MGGARGDAQAQPADGVRGVLQGSVGTNLRVWGDNEAVSIGVAPDDGHELLLSVERVHWPTQRSNGVTRGGTTTFISGEARFIATRFTRVSPYWLVGYGRGISRPNVNETFPDPVRNSAWVAFGGGGVRKHVNAHISAFVDVRVLLEGEQDSLVLLLPVRGGMAWRF